ncbi:MAG: glutamate--cysteine ligase [Acidisphaera sp.]|nr:glutamate--cysteine ligase [Acidisphaera sp.]MBV9812272.1 glutamate--cysteine ligase [Acetobacteraceae bacterium]
MSNPGEADTRPVLSVRQLAEYIADGGKPREQWRIGTEHEKFGFRHADFAPPPYEPDGIRALLEGMAHDGWSPIADKGNPIGLKRGAASVSLEPAGQLELSGGPVRTLHDTHAELEAHFADVHHAAGPLGLGFAPLGFHPTMPRHAMPWMPKSRYRIMRAYMPKVGSLGLDMMTRTCTVQVNLDFADERDMRRKLLVSLALQPVATALFANSPFTEGRPNGFLSYRAHVWTDTDADRSGMPAPMFEPGFGFERYVDWLLDVPMYFVIRDGAYVDMTEYTFRQFIDGRAHNLGVGDATVGDFADHMTTVFTDVRIKRFLEMRGADAGTPAMMLAQSALWVGLLYDDAALEAAHALVRPHGRHVWAALRDAVPREGLDARWETSTVRELARDVLAIARDGLRARECFDAEGCDETVHLAPVEEIGDGGPTQAEYWLDRFRDDWAGDVREIWREAAI